MSKSEEEVWCDYRETVFNAWEAADIKKVATIKAEAKKDALEAAKAEELVCRATQLIPSPIAVKPETILCAAIWLNDHKKHDQQPTNINEGFVISGRRHNNCYQTLTDVYGDCNEYLSKLDDYTDQQGFITSLDRYVNRKDGWVIALNVNQIINYSPSDSDGTLISEDLY